MYKFVYKKEFKRLDDGNYQLKVYAEDYYTEQALKNIIEDFSKKRTYLVTKINSMQDNNNVEMVIHTMLVGFVGKIVTIKKMKELGIEIYAELLDGLTEEQIKESEQLITDDELKKYNEARPLCERMIKEDLEKSKAELKEIDEVMPLWETALCKGESSSIVEKELNI